MPLASMPHSRAASRLAEQARICRPRRVRPKKSIRKIAMSATAASTHSTCGETCTSPTDSAVTASPVK